MTSINLQNILKETISVSHKAGAFILKEMQKVQSKDIELKGQHNYVTYVDKTTEAMIVEQLKALLPQAGFITEEDTIAHEDREYTWIIDPLDGTTNFLHHLPPFCVSIALAHENKPILGVIYEPNLNETFYATKGNGAFRNNEKIHASSSSDLDQALLATGFPYTDYHLLKPYMNVFEWCMYNTRGVRRLGSAAIDLAYVACGRMDGFFEYGLSPWDVAAGCIILQEAGGKLSDFSGNDNYIFGKEIIAFNNQLHGDFLEKFKQSFH